MRHREDVEHDEEHEAEEEMRCEASEEEHYVESQTLIKYLG